MTMHASGWFSQAVVDNAKKAKVVEVEKSREDDDEEEKK